MYTLDAWLWVLVLISLCDLLLHRIGSLQLVGAEISWFSELWNKTIAQTAANSVLGLITTGLISTVPFPSHSLLPLRMAFFLRIARMNKWKTNWIKARDRSTTTRLGFLVFFPGSASLFVFFFWVLRINIECPGIHIPQQLRIPKHLLFIRDLVQNLLLISLLRANRKCHSLC